MWVQIRTLWSRLNASYWFYPALFSMAGALLALGLIWLDRNGFSRFLNDGQWIVPARPQSASNMLTVIAGATIGIASTVFSITIAAVAYASGNYGPRLLTNFMEDKGNQFSLATFIGTFVYTITVLRTVRAEYEAPSSAADAMSTSAPGFVPQLSLLVAYALTMMAVAVLVFFLNHIPSSIRINTVLEGIGGRLLKDLAKIFPSVDTGRPTLTAPSGGRHVLSPRTGYIQRIDYAGLHRLACEKKVCLALEVRTGDFLHPGVPVARVIEGDDQELGLARYFILGAMRTPEQNPQFLIDELVEIGQRAMSPGINDPFTAITVLHWLGAATAELGGRELARSDLNLEEGGGQSRRIYPLTDDFEHFLRRGFGAMRSAASGSRIVALVMFDVLRSAAAPLADQSRKRLIRMQGDQLIEQARARLIGQDLQEVEARYAGFGMALS